jgi:hypothetical protein
VRAGAEVVIERNAEAVVVLRPAAPNIRLPSESLRLANERGSNATLDAATLKLSSAATANRSSRLRGANSRFEYRRAPR